ncbi:TPM domain-containing protein [Hymenobacter pini]|uniref:TPM domain-containing protein n=1 Tax=Hymenobacter pini TaxID=2880879 RepID=UPI001CF47DDD|nr:TPM domain-containing protein [Hymenobacter pini]MCA8832478.1 TPM domain-containing protein [Hymenobacter pini]
MTRLFVLLLLLVGSTFFAAQAQSAADLPPRPTPFRFINDQAQLLSAADAKTLESGLRRYADQNGTQIVVVTVPSLGGQSAAEYARAVGTNWGIGQRDKNNGVVVLLSKQERALSIQAGSGLRSRLTPEVTNQVINQMTSRFKQGNYFAGLRQGLNSLMYAADPSSAPTPATETPAATPGTDASAADYATASGPDEMSTTAPEPVATAPAAPVEPESSGFGMGTILLAVVVVGGGLWLVSKLFRRRSNSAPGNAPDFLPNQPNNPSGNYGRAGYGGQSGPDFLPNRGSSGGSGMGNVLLTGAAAAAGAYLGNRMADRNDDGTAHLSSDAPPRPLDSPAADNNAANSGGFPFLDGGASETSSAPDYFSSDNSGSEPDYFSSDNSSYDDSSSGDTGGGGFDDTSDNSGSW